MARSVILTLSLLSLVLVLSLWLLFDYANSTTAKENNLKQKVLNGDISLKDVSPWAKKMAESNNSIDYSPIVEEFFLELKLSPQDIAKKRKTKQNKKQKIYKLVIANLNRYSIFCVIQLLHKLKVSYILIDRKTSHQIYIKSKDKNRLIGLTKALKQYDIESSIETK